MSRLASVQVHPAGSTVTLRSRATADHVLIEVEDECGGLPDGNFNVLFQPFEQRGEDWTWRVLVLQEADGQPRRTAAASIPADCPIMAVYSASNFREWPILLRFDLT